MCKPNEEIRARDNLIAQGFEVWVPLYERRTRAKRGHKLPKGTIPTERIPLFPRYIFVRIGKGCPDEGLVRSTRGCHHLLCFGSGDPMLVRPSVMDALRAREANGVLLVDEDARAKVEYKFRYREVAKLTGEVLAGGSVDPMVRFLKYASAKTRAWVLMSILGEETKVQVATDSLEPLRV